MKKKKIVVANLSPNESTEYMKVGDWNREYEIGAEFMITGTVFIKNIGYASVMILVTNTTKEKRANSIGKKWWEKMKTDYKKLALWMPLNDISKMTYSGFNNIDRYLTIEIINLLIEQSGFGSEYEKALSEACKKNKVA